MIKILKESDHLKEDFLDQVMSGGKPTWKTDSIDEAADHLEIIANKFNVKWISDDAYGYYLTKASLDEVIKLLNSPDEGTGGSAMTLSSKGLDYKYDLSKREASIDKKYIIKVQVRDAEY